MHHDFSRRHLASTAVGLTCAALLAETVLLAQTAPLLGNARDHILSGRHATQRRGNSGRIHLVSWNIERGLKLPVILEFLRKQSPDICVLQEVDLNARRTGRRNVVEVIASELGLNYIYGVEFEELSQKSGSARAFQGQAILTWGDFHSPRVLRFRRQSDYWRRRWFLPNWELFQARDGGRMALAAELQLGRDRLAIYNLHLESKGHDELRVAQLMDVLDDSQQYPPDSPVLIAGDLNTRRTASTIPDTLLASRFYDACDTRDCRVTKPNGQRLDWIFGRGLMSFSETKAHRNIRASDHYPLSTVILLRP